MSENVAVGIYAAVYMQPIDGHKAFVDQFQSRVLRDDLAKGNLHTTVQYPEELISRGLGSHERARVPELAGYITTALGGLSLIDQVIEIDVEQGVNGRKKWWTIAVNDEYTDLFDGCRKVAADLTREIFPAINLAEYSPSGYHVSLTQRGNVNHDKLRTKIPPPVRWKIVGAGAIFRSDDLRNKSRHQSYVNRSRR